MKTTTLLSLLIVVSLAACSKKEPETAPAPTPVAAPTPVVAAPPAVPAAAIVPPSAELLVIGEKVYTATCLSCHGAAVLGAPKLGDVPSWTPRIAKGSEAMYKSAIDGFKMMPPRGGNAALKDDELKAAVDYMVSKAH